MQRNIKTSIIPIKKSPSTEFEAYQKEYNLFDPTTCSPPNNFLNKLNIRLSIYQPPPQSIITNKE